MVRVCVRHDRAYLTFQPDRSNLRMPPMTSSAVV